MLQNNQPLFTRANEASSCDKSISYLLQEKNKMYNFCVRTPFGSGTVTITRIHTEVGAMVPPCSSRLFFGLFNPLWSIVRPCPTKQHGRSDPWLGTAEQVLSKLIRACVFSAHYGPSLKEYLNFESFSFGPEWTEGGKR